MSARGIALSCDRYGLVIRARREKVQYSFLLSHGSCISSSSEIR